jgi:hypothetical protein
MQKEGIFKGVVSSLTPRVAALAQFEYENG